MRATETMFDWEPISEQSVMKVRGYFLQIKKLFPTTFKALYMFFFIQKRTTAEGKTDSTGVLPCPSNLDLTQFNAVS